MPCSCRALRPWSPRCCRLLMLKHCCGPHERWCVSAHWPFPRSRSPTSALWLSPPVQPRCRACVCSMPQASCHPAVIVMAVVKKVTCHSLSRAPTLPCSCFALRVQPRGQSNKRSQFIEQIRAAKAACRSGASPRAGSAELHCGALPSAPAPPSPLSVRQSPRCSFTAPSSTLSAPL